jgi:hypothetical protein
MGPETQEVNKKLLVVVPFWHGDRDLARRLVRLLVSLEPAYTTETELLLVSRGGVSIGEDILGYAWTKFKTHVHHSPRTESGWPTGCNNVSLAGFNWTLAHTRSGQSPYKAIFSCAPDCCPLVPDALPYIHRRWDAMSARGWPPYYAGYLVPAGQHEHEHINGDCSLISCDIRFLSWLVRRCTDEVDKGGWDWVLAEEFKTQWGWQHIPGIRSEWQRPTFNESEWQEFRDDGVSWLHGVKDFSLLELAEKKLL